MSTQIFVKIENQKQNIISNLFQDLKFEKKNYISTSEILVVKKTILNVTT